MREERKVTDWLADYRDSLDGLSTPSRVEAQLRAEVRRRRRVAVAPWILAVGAAAVLLLGIWIGQARPVARAPVVAARQASPEPMRIPEGPVRVTDVEDVPAAPQAVARALPRFAAPRMAVRQPQAFAETVPVFVMLPGSELMPAAQDLQVLRVRIPRTRIQALGWPVNMDRLDERVLADVLVGTDGVARAVRLVGASQ